VLRISICKAIAFHEKKKAKQRLLTVQKIRCSSASLLPTVKEKSPVSGETFLGEVFSDTSTRYYI